MADLYYNEIQRERNFDFTTQNETVNAAVPIVVACFVVFVVVVVVIVVACCLKLRDRKPCYRRLRRSCAVCLPRRFRYHSDKGTPLSERVDGDDDDEGSSMVEVLTSSSEGERDEVDGGKENKRRKENGRTGEKRKTRRTAEVGRKKRIEGKAGGRKEGEPTTKLSTLSGREISASSRRVRPASKSGRRKSAGDALVGRAKDRNMRRSETWAGDVEENGATAKEKKTGVEMSPSKKDAARSYDADERSVVEKKTQRRNRLEKQKNIREDDEAKSESDYGAKNRPQNGTKNNVKNGGNEGAINGAERDAEKEEEKNGAKKSKSRWRNLFGKKEGRGCREKATTTTTTTTTSEPNGDVYVALTTTTTTKAPPETETPSRSSSSSTIRRIATSLNMRDAEIGLTKDGKLNWV